MLWRRRIPAPAVAAYRYVLPSREAKAKREAAANEGESSAVGPRNFGERISIKFVEAGGVGGPDAGVGREQSAGLITDGSGNSGGGSSRGMDSPLGGSLRIQLAPDHSGASVSGSGSGSGGEGGMRMYAFHVGSEFDPLHEGGGRWLQPSGGDGGWGLEPASENALVPIRGLDGGDDGVGGGGGGSGDGGRTVVGDVAKRLYGMHQGDSLTRSIVWIVHTTVSNPGAAANVIALLTLIVYFVLRVRTVFKSRSGLVLVEFAVVIAVVVYVATLSVPKGVNAWPTAVAAAIFGAAPFVLYEAFQDREGDQSNAGNGTGGEAATTAAGAGENALFPDDAAAAAATKPMVAADEARATPKKLKADAAERVKVRLGGRSGGVAWGRRIGPGFVVADGGACSGETGKTDGDKEESEDKGSDGERTGILGYGAHGTVVFEGRLEGRAVAVKRLLRAYYKSAVREATLLIRSDGHVNVVRYFASKESADGVFVYLALERCDGALGDLVASARAQAHVQLKNRLYDEVVKRMFGASGGSRSGGRLGREGRGMEKGGVPPGLVSNGSESVACTLEPVWTDAGLDDDAVQFCRELFEGVAHIHRLRIVHRDIKPNNVLVVRREGLLESAAAKAKAKAAVLAARIREKGGATRTE